MIEVRNKLVSLLHKHVEKPVIPNDTTGKRPDYPYIDYSVITVTNDAGGGNYSYDGSVERVDLQKQTSFSINSYSESEVEAYVLAKSAWDFFKLHVSIDDLTIVRISEVTNRTMLKVDEYERRFGFDVFIRYSEAVEKGVEGIGLDDLTITRR